MDNGLFSYFLVFALTVVLSFISYYFVFNKREGLDRSKKIVYSMLLALFVSISVEGAMYGDQRDLASFSDDKLEKRIKNEYGDIEIEEEEVSDERDEVLDVEDEYVEGDIEIINDDESSNSIKEEDIKKVEHKKVDPLKVHVIDIGQGDSILVETPSKRYTLIDGGKRSESDNLLSYLKKHNVEKIDNVIATHPHEDHIGGLVPVMEKIEVDNVYLPDVTHTTKTFENFLLTIKNNEINPILAASGDGFSLGDGAYIKILHPQSKKYNDLNDYSVVTKLDYNNYSVMLTGDAEAISENEMVGVYGDELKADILKVGHHGSSTSTTDTFLDFVQPKVAAISYGENNKYNHPHPEVINKLEGRGIKYYETAIHGDIVFTIADKIDVTTSKRR